MGALLDNVTLADEPVPLADEPVMLADEPGALAEDPPVLEVTAALVAPPVEPAVVLEAAELPTDAALLPLETPAPDEELELS